MTEIRLVQTSAPDIGNAEHAAVARVLDSGYFGMGPEVSAFEQELGAYIGGDRSVICTATGTAALHLAMKSAGIGPGDEVLLPALTFVGSFQAVAATGARPVACDVQLDSGLIDIDDAQRRLTPRTRAIMPVHYAGYAGDLDAVHDFARKRGLRVIEDAAHAFGSRCRGRLIGSFGDIVCFSFDPIKNITAGQGGAVVTEDAEVAADVRLRRELGIERGAGLGASADFDVGRLGWRYAMSDLMAAIGRVQLARFESDLKPARLARANEYRTRLGAIAGLSQLLSDDEAVPHIAPVRINPGARDAVSSALAAAGFETRVHYKPNHLLRMFGDGEARPSAERLYRELLTLPLHAAVSFAHIRDIASIIRDEMAARAQTPP